MKHNSTLVLTKYTTPSLSSVYMWYFLLQVGEKLGRYEVEKKKAVELEDYDLAMEKKVSETMFSSALSYYRLCLDMQVGKSSQLGAGRVVSL